MQAFPIPRDSMQIGNQKGRRYELIDKDHALHHLIRQPGKQFCSRIRIFDKMFREKKAEEITDEQVFINSFRMLNSGL